jgi:hypothetical protein
MVINKRAAPLWKTQVPGQAVTKVIHTCCMVHTIPLARPRFRQTCSSQPKQSDIA